MTLEKTFEEQSTLNQAVVSVVNEAARAMLEYLPHEIQGIIPLASTKQATEIKAEAERRKREEIWQKCRRRNQFGTRKATRLRWC